MVSAEGDVVCEGDHVVLDVNNGERLVVTQVTRKTKVKLSKRGYASVMPLLGKCFGTIFEVSVDGKCLEVGTEETLSVLNGSFKTKSTERNNAKLVDDGTAQKLGHEDIERMKAQGVKSGELIDKLVANSATFQDKTEFSQEKYKRKKQKKHCVAFVLCRPCAQLLCEAYFNKSPERIRGLRVDTLSLLLSLANVAARERVLVVEECAGLVMGSVLERLGGHGHCHSASPHLDTRAKMEALAQNVLESGQRVSWRKRMQQVQPSTDIVKFFNFEENITANATYGTLGELLEANGRAEGVTIEIGDGDKGGAREAGAEDEGEGEGEDEGGRPGKKQKTWREQRDEAGRQTKRKHLPKRATGKRTQELAQSKFTSLVLAAPSYNPETLVDRCLSLLSPSATFAIYSPWLQPLVDCKLFLHRNKLALRMQLCECFWREHQVLPERTHPQMNMTTGPTGGYILAGVASDAVLGHGGCSDLEKTAISRAAEPKSVSDGGREGVGVVGAGSSAGSQE